MNHPIHDSDRIQTDSPGKGRPPTLFGAKAFLGDEVYNQREDRLGKLKEFMLDLDSGRICYAVMSSGGFLGVGEKLFAVPWRALTLDAENACFVLDIAEERLMNSPGFDKRHWPDMCDAGWVKDIDTFYGIPPEPCAGKGINII
ncbi:MAG: PRC-barrel domain-containing protein [Thiobacillus sp.]|nr:PRC-barrel domain-containing protein [Thiobacillus sp.]